MTAFRISAEPIDPAALARSLVHARAGACTTFEGWVRDHNDGRAVQRLDYQAYAALAQSEGERIIGEAREKFAIVEACCVHRAGALARAAGSIGSALMRNAVIVILRLPAE